MYVCTYPVPIPALVTGGAASAGTWVASFAHDGAVATAAPKRGKGRVPTRRDDVAVCWRELRLPCRFRGWMPSTPCSTPRERISQEGRGKGTVREHGMHGTACMQHGTRQHESGLRVRMHGCPCATGTDSESAGQSSSTRWAGCWGQQVDAHELHPQQASDRRLYTVIPGRMPTSCHSLTRGCSSLQGSRRTE